MRRRFAHPDPGHRPHGAGAILRWAVLDRILGRRRARSPGPAAPRVAPVLDLVRAEGGPSRLTWIGHASFLLSIGGHHLLIDPVFARRAGHPYPRAVAPGLAPSDLPQITAVLVTHNHYDHLDAAFVRALEPSVTVVVPTGLGRWVRRRHRGSVVELEWWQRCEVEGVEATLVPARHWSRRGVLDTNRSLWGGWVVRAGDASVYHAGDTAFFEGFAEIGRRFPRLDVALLPVGGYDPGWFMERHHMTPEQAGRAFLDLGARLMVPMHWGVFKLTDEPLTEPAERLHGWWLREGHPPQRLRVLAVGETMALVEG